MLTVFGSVIAGAAPTGSFKATPGVDTPDETIDGFPEFTQDVDLIDDPTIKPRLRALAKKIVASHNGPGPRIIGFEVHGHADATTRIQDRKEAAQTEQEVSDERADNAKELLLQLIEEEGGKPIITGIRANAKAKGFGSQFRKFVPARTEPEMKKNRRVEIFLKQFVPPPPRPSPPPPPPPPPKPPEPGTVWSIQIKNGTVLTVGIPGGDDFSPSSISYLIQVEVIDVLRKQRALFQIRATGVALPGASALPLGAQTSSMTAGDPTTFKSTARTNLGLFEGDVEFSQDPGFAISFKSFGGNINFLKFQRVDTRPPIVSCSNGSSFDTVPQGSLGATAKGTMKMIGSIKPAK
jgi:hypothetical protein